VFVGLGCDYYSTLLIPVSDWLELDQDPSLQVAAALALGNFACNETISFQLVSSVALSNHYPS
jgi:hypothetical protein